MNPREVADLIRAGLPNADIHIESDDDRHFAARVVAPEFAGLKRIARHQLIYRALGAPMGREIHALTIDAASPEEWAVRMSS